MKATIRTEKANVFFNAFKIFCRRLMRHHRQDGRGHGDGITAEHEFHDAVRHGERRQTSLWHALRQRKIRIDKEVDLPDADAEKPGNHQARHVADARVVERDPKAESHPLLHQQRNLHKKLQHSADEHTNGQGNSGLFEVMPYHSHGKDDDGQIQEEPAWRRAIRRYGSSSGCPWQEPRAR